MTDIVERLRNVKDWSDAIPIMEEAADEIIALRLLRDQLLREDKRIKAAYQDEIERLQRKNHRLINFIKENISGDVDGLIKAVSDE